MTHKPLFTLFLTTLLAGTAYSQTQEKDTLFYWLDEITLTEHRNISAISGTMARGIAIDTKVMESYPKILGYMDPMRYIQSLPGVSTNAAAEGGMHVQGGEHSHNLIAMCGAPIYNSSHVAGIFSIINQDHLPKVNFSTSTTATYLGAELSLDHPDTIPDHISGTATVGLISAQGTLSAPLSRRTALTVSARRSFINLLYGNMFQFDGNPLHFGFTDANLTLMHRIDSNNELDLNLFCNLDKGKCSMGGYDVGIHGNWQNAIGTMRWRHKGHIPLTTTAFVSHTSMEGHLRQEENNGHITNHITHYNIRTQASLPRRIRLDADASYYDILPQAIDVSRNKPETAVREDQDVLQLNASVSRAFSIGNSLTLTPHLLATGYNESGHYSTFNVNPSLIAEYEGYHLGTLTFETGYKHQYLAQTGMTSTGLPIEFWVASGHYFKPQEALFATLTYDKQFMSGKYALTLQVYGKRLENQIEYIGYVYDLLLRPYKLENNLIICSGYNYGANVMLTKQAGRFTGWISYSFGQSIREGDGIKLPTLFHSMHERKHEFNAVLSYKTGPYEFGGTLVYSSGKPYTPAKNLYLISNSIVIYYDKYNSATLPPYMRLDLSATYNLKSHGRYRHSVNLSVCNATAYKGYTMGYLKADKEEKTVKYKLASFIIPVMPSLSYTCRF